MSPEKREGHSQFKDELDSKASDDNRPCQDGLDRLFLWLAEKRMVLVSFFAMVVLIIGYWGYQINAGDGFLSPFNVLSLYHSLQLFVYESGFVQNPSIQLKFARFFAPIITAYAVILLLRRIFRWNNWISQTFHGFVEKKFILICVLALIVFALGYWGIQILAGEGLISQFNMSSICHSLLIYILGSGFIQNPPLQLKCAWIFASIIEAYVLILVFGKILEEDDKIDRFLRWLADKQLIFISIFALIVLILGYWGFQIIEGNEFFSPFNTSSMYRTLQLFVLESGLIQNPPWPLEFARFFAPIIAAYAIILLFIKIFWENIQDLILRCRWIIRPQVIICGLGYLGPLYVQRLRNRGYLPVIIEKDQNNPMNRTIGPFNSMIIVGDATDPEVLKRANIKRSRGLILVTGDDTTNIHIKMSAKKLLDKSKKEKKDYAHSPFHEILHIEDRWLGEALPKHDVFNMYENAAKKLYCWLWRESHKDEKRLNPHILLVGMGTMGEAFCKEIIRRFNGSFNTKLTISFMDKKDVSDKKKRLDLWIEGEHPQKRNSIKIIAYNYKIPSAPFLTGNYLTKDPKNPITSIVICLANETLAITTALKLTDIIKKIGISLPKKQKIPIFVRTIREDDGTYNFIHDVLKEQDTCKIIPYSIVEYGACPENIMDEKFPNQLPLIKKISGEKRMKPFYIAYAGIIPNEKGEILLIRRSEHSKTNPLLWEPPGGKPDPGETLDESLKREVREETGLEVDVYSPAGTAMMELSDKRIAYLIMLCKIQKGSICLSDEHCEYMWVDPKEVNKVQLASQFVEFFKNYHFTG